LRSIGAKKANREHIHTEKHINLLKEVGKNITGKQ